MPASGRQQPDAKQQSRRQQQHQPDRQQRHAIQNSSLNAASGDVTLTPGVSRRAGTMNAGTAAIIASQNGNVDAGRHDDCASIQLKTFRRRRVNPVLRHLLGCRYLCRPQSELPPRAGPVPGDVGVGAYISGATSRSPPARMSPARAAGMPPVVAAQAACSSATPTTRPRSFTSTLAASRTARSRSPRCRCAISAGHQLAGLADHSVDQLTGFSAAVSSFIEPLIKKNYQLNGCPIESVNSSGR